MRGRGTEKWGGKHDTVRVIVNSLVYVAEQKMRTAHLIDLKDKPKKKEK